MRPVARAFLVVGSLFLSLPAFSQPAAQLPETSVAPPRVPTQRLEGNPLRLMRDAADPPGLLPWRRDVAKPLVASDRRLATGLAAGRSAVPDGVAANDRPWAALR